jgi:radical SAM superfamily enzyme YgiQ (UPF0313 family)
MITTKSTKSPAVPRVLLIGTYDLGRQPFGLASAAAWLADAGFAVDCLDLSRSELDADVVSRAQVIGFYVPMHTATRLALDVLRDVRQINPAARICFYGLYGRANAEHLRVMGADAVISGEFEAELVRFVEGLAAAGPGADEAPSSSQGPRGPSHWPGSGTHARSPVVISSLEKLAFRVPDRSGLPPLADYAQLAIGDARRVVGYTEATRGCRHMCRHWTRCTRPLNLRSPKPPVKARTDTKPSTASTSSRAAHHARGRASRTSQSPSSWSPGSAAANQ